MKEKYNPRTGEYEPVPHENFRVSMRAGGVYVEDDHKMLSFFIKRGTGNIEIARGTGKSDREHPEKYVKKFTQSEAMKIAEMVKRNVPRSKYKDYRYFCMNCASPDEKTDESYELACQYVKVHGHEAAMRLYEKYKYLLDMDDETINESVLNEDDWMDVRDARSTQGESRGTRIHGLKGFLLSLPSAVISTVINWPTALFNLIGSIHIRAEKRWKNTFLNPNVWKDFIQTPREKKEDDRLLTQKEFDRLSQSEKETYLHKMFIINNHFYWAELSNGDVIRVIGSSPEEAMLNAIATVKKLKPIYTALNAKSDEGRVIGVDPVTGKDIKDYVYATYRIIYDDNEVSLWSEFETDAGLENAKKCSFQLREIVCDVYVETLLHDMPESKWRQDRNQIRKKYRPAISKVEQLGKGYIIEVPSDERDKIIIHESYRYDDRGNFGNLYKVSGLSWMELYIAASKSGDVNHIVNGFTNDADFKNLVKNNQKACADYHRNPRGNIKCYKIVMNNGDIFHIYIDPSDVMPQITALAKKMFKTTRNTQQQNQQNNQNPVCTPEELAQASAQFIENLIVTSSKNYYRNVAKASTMFRTSAYYASSCEEVLSNPPTINWLSEMSAVQVDTDTRTALSQSATAVPLPRVA